MSGDPAAGSAVQKADLDQKGLVDFFDGVGLLGERRAERVQAHRAALVLLDDGEQQFAVDFVEAMAINFEHAERRLGGGQIDGEGNVNLVGTGAYPSTEVRWPGSFGSAYLYFLVPRVILFREEHTRRVLVEKVDFISAPGKSDKGIYRPGGPHALLTNLALFDYDRVRHRFRLRSVHPGHSVEEVLDNTGFAFERPETVPRTPSPDPETLALIRGPIRGEIAEVYPRFAATAFAPRG